MSERITELPMLEAVLWESAVAAAAEGDAEQVAALSALLAGLGYDVERETMPAPALILRHRHTGQTMRRYV